jgi:hypothetical protein
MGQFISDKVNTGRCAVNDLSSPLFKKKLSGRSVSTCTYSAQSLRFSSNRLLKDFQKPVTSFICELNPNTKIMQLGVGVRSSPS